jgi:hypothetical protein
LQPFGARWFTLLLRCTLFSYTVPGRLRSSAWPRGQPHLTSCSEYSSACWFGFVLTRNSLHYAALSRLLVGCLCRAYHQHLWAAASASLGSGISISGQRHQHLWAAASASLGSGISISGQRHQHLSGQRHQHLWAAASASLWAAASEFLGNGISPLSYHSSARWLSTSIQREGVLSSIWFHPAFSGFGLCKHVRHFVHCSVWGSVC